MKVLNSYEITVVSGAVKYIEITEKLIVRGIPESCIANYYHSNKDDLNSVYAENIVDAIYQECSYDLNFQFEFIPVRVLLIN